MHPLICQFPSKRFYQDNILNGITAADRASPDLTCFPYPDVPLLFLNIVGGEREVGNSRSNENEAVAVRDVVQLMLSKGIDYSRIGVISPYGGQVGLLRQTLKFPERIQIASVDSFQGGESDYIILSCVRTGESIGFLSDFRRLNVSLTRARYGLVIVGDAATLSSHSDDWRALIDHYQEANLVRDSLPHAIEKRTGAKLAFDRRAAAGDASRPPPPVKPRAEPAVIKARVSDATMRVIWPDVDDEIAYLQGWVASLIAKLDTGKFVTVALDSQALDFEPLCVQITSVLPETFDPFQVAAACPATIPTDGVIVFCVSKTGTPIWSQVSNTLRPLLTHPKISIAVFDFPDRVLLLDKIGIASEWDRLIDVQLLNVALADTASSPQDPGSLFATIVALDDGAPAVQVDVEMLKSAKAFVTEDTEFPWDANPIVLEEGKLPVTTIVDQRFLEYAGSRLMLIQLLLGNVIRRDGIGNVAALTQTKLRESF
jgi:hypothetical protein